METGDTRAIRLLIADTCETNVSAIERLLRTQAGVRVVGRAHSGRTAVEQIRSLQPDTALIDMGLPDMDGIECARLLADELPGLRIIVMASRDDPRYMAAAKAVGAAGFVVKSELRHELASLLFN